MTDPAAMTSPSCLPWSIHEEVLDESIPVLLGLSYHRQSRGDGKEQGGEHNVAVHLGLLLQPGGA